jgi:thiol-disulfide isomerase/thioredoxin
VYPDSIFKPIFLLNFKEGKMDIREVYENMDKKHALVVVLLALIAIATTFSAFQTYKLNQVLSGEAPSAPAAERPARPSADNPTKKPSEYKIGMDYKKAIESKKPMLILFYADWCGFCVRFMPIYEKLYKAHKRNFNFVKINVEDEQYADVVKKYEISAFPTVFLVNTKEDTREKLQNRDFGDMDKLNGILNDFYKENK